MAFCSNSSSGSRRRCCKNSIFMVRYLMCKDFMMVVVDFVFWVGHIAIAILVRIYKNWILASDTRTNLHHPISLLGNDRTECHEGRSEWGKNGGWERESRSGSESHSHLTNPLFVINIHNNFFLSHRSSSPFAVFAVNVFMLALALLASTRCAGATFRRFQREREKCTARGLSAWYG